LLLSAVGWSVGEPSVPSASCGKTCTPRPETPRTTSALPSPVMSPTATESGPFGYVAAVGYETGGRSAPSDACANTQSRKSRAASFAYEVVITTSARPSPVTSPTATASGEDPTEYARYGWKRPGGGPPGAVAERLFESGPSPTELRALTWYVYVVPGTRSTSVYVSTSPSVTIGVGWAPPLPR
jgi:hypothetical protein